MVIEWCFMSKIGEPFETIQREGAKLGVSMFQYIPYSMGSQLELQSEFTSHIIVIPLNRNVQLGYFKPS